MKTVIIGQTGKSKKTLLKRRLNHCIFWPFFSLLINKGSIAHQYSMVEENLRAVNVLLYISLSWWALSSSALILPIKQFWFSMWFEREQFPNMECIILFLVLSFLVHRAVPSLTFSVWLCLCIVWPEVCCCKG